MNFIVKEKEIFYKDRVWSGGVRCIPKDEEFIKKIILSRNKIPKQLLTMFELSDKDRKEYESCKTEEDLSEKIIYDCNSKGLILLDKVVMDNEKKAD